MVRVDQYQLAARAGLLRVLGLVPLEVSGGGKGDLNNKPTRPPHLSTFRRL